MNPLPLLVALPLLAALAVALAPARLPHLARILATIGAALPLGLAWHLLALPEAGVAWLGPSWGNLAGVELDGLLRADALSGWLVNLTCWLGCAAVWTSWRNQADRDARIQTVLALALQSALTLVFLAGDLISFVIGFEAALVPPLIGALRLGGAEGRAAGMRFLTYMATGSALLLAAVVILIARGQAGLIADLPQAVRHLGPGEARACFVLLVAALAFKLPLLGLHAWQAPLYACLPAGLAVLVTGGLSKVAVYGLLRLVLPAFPAEWLAARPWLLGLGLATVLGAGLMAAVETSALRVLAYLSLSHLGLMTMALAAGGPTALDGVAAQMLGHGLAMGALFALAGAALAGRASADLDRQGGFIRREPLLAVLTVLAALAAVGVPPNLGFVGEFLMIVGLVQALGAGPAGVLLAAGGGLSLVLAVVAMTRYLRTMVFHDDPETAPSPAAAAPACACHHCPVLFPLAVGALLVLGLALGLRAAPITGAGAAVAPAAANGGPHARP